SFGISGTNAHVIVEEAPAPEAEAEGHAERPDPPSGDEHPRHSHSPPTVADECGRRASALVVSGRTGPAMRAQADRLRAHLAAHPDLDLADVAYSLTATRESFGCRGVVLGGDRDRVLAGLDA